MDKIIGGVLLGIAVVLLGLGLSFITALVGMFCWNMALTHVFPQVPEISYWQMYGLMVLSSLMFGTGSIKRD